MGYAVYKAEDFIATSDMTIGYNNHLNKYTGTYITTVADRIRGKYNFGYKRNAPRLAKEIITLPAPPMVPPTGTIWKTICATSKVGKSSPISATSSTAPNLGSVCCNTVATQITLQPLPSAGAFSYPHPHQIKSTPKTDRSRHRSQQPQYFCAVKSQLLTASIPRT